jgi:hypothetical protein
MERRPEKNDSIYSTDDPRTNACVSSYVSWSEFESGYRKAADELVDKCIQDHSLLDVYVYPIFYLYRHYLELAIKLLFVWGVRENVVPSIPNNGHNLERLWNEIKSIINKGGDLSKSYKPNEPITQEAIKNADRLIKEISELDQRSTTFRYPIDKDKNPSIPLNLTNLNISSIKNCTHKLSTLINDIHFLFCKEHRVDDVDISYIG